MEQIDYFGKMHPRLLERLEEVRDCGLPIVCSPGRKIIPTHRVIGWLDGIPEYVSDDLFKNTRELNLGGLLKNMESTEVFSSNKYGLFQALSRAMGKTPRYGSFSAHTDLEFHQWYDPYNDQTYTTIMPSLMFVDEEKRISH